MTFLEMQTLLGYYTGEASPAWFPLPVQKEFLNRAYQELYGEIVQNNEHYFDTTSSINLVAGTELYTLPTNNRIQMVEYVPTAERTVPLNKIDMLQRPRYLNQQYQVNLLGEPVYYLKANQIGIVPVPTASITSGLRVTITPPVTLLSANGDVPPLEWPAEYHEAIVFGALKRCAMRDKDLMKTFNEMFNVSKDLLLRATAIRDAQSAEMIIDTDWG